MNEDRVLSFGEKAVGLSFNPSGDHLVVEIKRYFAGTIDVLQRERINPLATDEQKRMYSIAITEAQTAQMWAVKAATWK